MDIAFSAGDILWYKLTHQIVDTATEKRGLEGNNTKTSFPPGPRLSMALRPTVLDPFSMPEKEKRTDNPPSRGAAVFLIRFMFSLVSLVWLVHAEND